MNNTILYNRIDRKILKKNMESNPIPRINLSFYKYIHISETHSLRDELYKAWSTFNVLGRVYVATEGINVQISVPKSNLEKFQANLSRFNIISDVFCNFSINNSPTSFFKLTIKVKNKIVADGLEKNQFQVYQKKSKYISSIDFNSALQNHNYIIVDVRNQYENYIGHFPNSILLQEKKFRDCLPRIKEKLQLYKKKKKIVLYCTGGIRCEKANVYLKEFGFDEIYQLRGGITSYLRSAKEKKIENLFIGKNFTYDERLGEEYSFSNQKIISHCDTCNSLCDTYTNCNNDSCHVLFLQCKSCEKNYNGCCSEKCKKNFSFSIKRKVS